MATVQRLSLELRPLVKALQKHLSEVKAVEAVFVLDEGLDVQVWIICERPNKQTEQAVMRRKVEIRRSRPRGKRLHYLLTWRATPWRPTPTKRDRSWFFKIYEGLGARRVYPKI